MTEDRQMIMAAVLEGKLDASHVTMEEIKEVERNVLELIAERHAEEQLAREDIQYFELENVTLQ